MGLKFRRGTTAQKSGSLAFGEPYVNTDLGTLQIGGASGDITLGASGTGSAGQFSTISGSALRISGNAQIDGNLTLGGAITIGDNSSDTVNVVASLSSSLIPSLDNKFDLGDVNHIWRDLYISTGSIKMVSNGAVVSTLSNTGNGMALDQGLTAGGDITTTANIKATGSISASTFTGLGNLTSYSSSIDQRIKDATNEQFLGAFATTSSLSDLSASIATTDSTQTNNITTAQNSANRAFASASAYSASAATSLNSLSSSIATTDSTQTNNITTAQNSANGAFASASAYSASIYTRDANQDTLITANGNAAAGAFASASAYSASAATSLNNLSSSIASTDATETTNITTAQNSANGAFASASAYSASAASALSSVSGAVATSLTNASASAYSTFAKLNAANVFTGTQTITGSLFVSANLVVQGSSSLQNITASAASIGTNTVILNTATPSVRFGGIAVQDSGSGAGTSGSLLWDSQNDVWLYQQPSGAPEGYGSARLISGPKNSGSLGSELGLTVGQIMVAVGDDHIGDSIISASATKVTIVGDLDTIGNISSSTITGIGNVTAYSTSVASRINTIATTYATSASIASATATSITTLSASIYTTDATQTTNITANTNAAAGAFASASAYSASIATTDATQTTNIATATAAAAGAFASASAYSASIATTDNAQQVQINSLINSYVSASTVTSLSTSVASRLNTVETAGYAVSSSVATATANSISTLSSSIFTTDATQTTNIATATAAAAGAFASASAYSASIAANTVTFNGSAVKLGGSATITATATNALTIGTGLSGTSYNGSAAVTIANTGVTSITTNTGLSTNASATGGVTITNTGVTSNVAGTGISVSGATGAVTITNSGVTSAVAGTGVSVSAGTGAVTFSIGQAVATTSAVTFASVAATGDIVAYSTSDKRHKNNINLIPDALTKVTKLNGVTWEWNDDVDDVTKLSPKTGLIAQEVQEVLPEVVTERENGFLGLDYSKMVGLLVEAIKEQQTQITELKAEIEALKK